MNALAYRPLSSLVILLWEGKKEREGGVKRKEEDGQRNRFIASDLSGGKVVPLLAPATFAI